MLAVQAWKLLDPQCPCKKLSLVVCSYNPGTEKVGVGSPVRCTGWPAELNWRVSGPVRTYLKSKIGTEETNSVDFRPLR